MSKTEKRLLVTKKMKEESPSTIKATNKALAKLNKAFITKLKERNNASTI